MLPFKDFMKFKMRTQPAAPWKYLINSLVLLALLAFVCADDTAASAPASLLAEQTGASQFEEERLQPHSDCNDRKRHQKRSSDEDIDYEVYQGVVGRPGIDFPIYPRIPKTSFSCRSFGNGYFADMETDCQVFHICEEGRKISFLCPNGTIFQQSELTCDWWFKVNCLGSPGYYADSAEILNKQRVQRIRPSVPVSVGFNIVGGGGSVRSSNSNNKQRVDSSAKAHQKAGGHRNKPERRIDSIEEPALESVDFDDFSGEKQLKHSGKSKVSASIDSNNNNDESQITAESASILGTNWRNSQHAAAAPDQTRTEKPHKTSESRIGTVPARVSGGSNRRGNTGHTNERPTGNSESRERSRHGQRGQQRYTKDDEKKPLVESFEINSSGERLEPKKPFVLPEKIIKAPASAEGRGKSGGSSNILAETPSGKSVPDTYTHRTVDKAVPSTTSFYPSGTYSTARRFEPTKSTPFYTPTVPTISKSKTTEGKSHYVKGNSVTTPNPNRFNGGASGSGLFFESSAAPKISTTSASPKQADASNTATTLRPFIIGMRHEIASPDYRVPLTAQNVFNGDKKLVSESHITTTTPASTRPTYLPKSGFDMVPTIEAGGDSLLFAPVPSGKNDHLTLNVKGMLKAMDYIKDELKDVESVGPRAGLEIPPSSGPNAVHSLAVYYGLSEAEDAKSAKTPAPVKSSTTSTTKSPASSSTAAASSTSTAITNNDKSSPASKSSSPNSSLTAKVAPSGDIKASLLSERTQTKYTNLFGLADPKAKNIDDLSRGLAGSSEGDSATDKYSKHQTFPQIGSTDATISKLASTEGYRSIAKEFSNALTTYLETPDKLRQQLQAVRPTPPSARGKGESTATDATLFQRGTAASYLPTQATQTDSSRFTTTTQDSIAAEINSKFDYSTVTPDFASTTDVFDTTTYRPSRKPVTEFSGEVVPRGNDSGESDGEILQRENTHSFVNARNQLGYDKPTKSKGSGEKGGVTTKPKTTENPWSHASQTDFLDPLTINDGLMKETKPTTATPFVKERLDKTTTAASVGGRGQINVLSSDTGRKFVGSAEVTTTTTKSPYYYERSQGGTDSWGDILSSYDLPRETLPSSSGLQRIANKIFGGLNESEALHLKNVMAEAEHNRQVLSLLLLLIQTCDDLNGKALERSRKHLLNALIDMDSKLKTGKGAPQKAAPLVTTTSRTINSSPSAAYYTATTDQAVLSTTTTTATINTSTVGSAAEETTKFEIRVEDPEDEMASSTATTPGGSAGRGDTSDKRALELLKSLYSLASKFTSRR